MFSSLRKDLSRKYGPRFGQIAIELGFLTEPQLDQALSCQVREERNGNGHKLLGAILFERDILSAAQVDKVMTELFRRTRRERAAIHESPRPSPYYAGRDAP